MGLGVWYVRTTYEDELRGDADEVCTRSIDGSKSRTCRSESGKPKCASSGLPWHTGCDPGWDHFSNLMQLGTHTTKGVAVAIEQQSILP